MFGHMFYVLQFYLDMKFVICFASQGRYLSRNLARVVNEIISKAMAAFATTGIDPNRSIRINIFISSEKNYNVMLLCS